MELPVYERIVCTVSDDTTIELEIGPDYIFARQTGTPRTPQEARAVHDAVTAAVEESGHRQILLDNRATLPPCHLALHQIAVQEAALGP